MERYNEQNRHEIGQAESMSRFAGIELSDGQVEDYGWARKSEDQLFAAMSDQNLLYLCLNPQQQIEFSKCFNNIDFVV